MNHSCRHNSIYTTSSFYSNTLLSPTTHKSFSQKHSQHLSTPVRKYLESNTFTFTSILISQNALPTHPHHTPRPPSRRLLLRMRLPSSSSHTNTHTNIYTHLFALPCNDSLRTKRRRKRHPHHALSRLRCRDSRPKSRMWRFRLESV